jgi:hypothetical protein
MNPINIGLDTIDSYGYLMVELVYNLCGNECVRLIHTKMYFPLKYNYMILSVNRLKL